MGKEEAAVIGAGALAAGVGYFLLRRVPPGMGRLEVVVRDRDTWNPVGGATVSVDTAGSKQTDPSGRAVFDLDPGEYEVRASCPGYLDASTVTAVEADTTRTVTLVLGTTPEPPGRYDLEVTVRGWVDFGSDEYLVTKWVRVRRPVEGLLVSAEGPTPREAYTRADGTASLDYMLEGPYTILIKDGERVLHTVSVTVDRDMEVDVELPETVELPRVRADPILREMGGGFRISAHHVPVGGGIEYFTVSGGLPPDYVDDSIVQVFESDSPSTASPYEPGAHDYNPHNIYMWTSFMLFYWEGGAACRSGDMWETTKGATEQLAWEQAYALASGHVDDVVARGAGNAAYIGERWADSASYGKIGVRGQKRYLHIKVLGKTGAVTMLVLPIAVSA